MAEIYTDTSEWVYLNVYQDGALANADATPTVVVTDGDGTDLGTHTVSAVSTGIYKVLVELSDTDVEKRINIDWSFTMGAVLVEKRDTFDVVTPYMDVQTIKDMYMAQKGYTDWASLTAAQQDDVNAQTKYAEQYARFMIDTYTSSTFGLKRKTLAAYGQNTDVLTFDERITTIEKIWINGELNYDIVSVPTVDNLPYDPVVTETNYGIRLEPLYDIQEYEYINPVYKYGYFKKGWRYNVQGLYGWDGVPSQIEFAAKALVDDYFCKDTTWQNKYVSSLQSSDWKIAFDRVKFVGTGNFLVDKILGPFKDLRFMVV